MGRLRRQRHSRPDGPAARATAVRERPRDRRGALRLAGRLPGVGPGVHVRILFIVPYAPTQIRTRPLHMIRALRSDGHDVTVATLWTSDEERAALGELEADGSRLIAERQPLARLAWNCLRALAGTEPLQAHYSWRPEAGRASAAGGGRHAIRRRARRAPERRPLRTHAGSLMSGRTLRPALIWDSVDCISLLFRARPLASQVPQARLAARLELPRTRRYEGRVGQSLRSPRRHV